MHFDVSYEVTIVPGIVSLCLLCPDETVPISLHSHHRSFQEKSQDSCGRSGL